MTISRRTALGAGVAAALAGASSAQAKLLFGKAGLPLGINLYMLGSLVRQDLEGTLKSVAAIGFREIESDLGSFPAAKLTAALKASGLRCSNLGILPTPLRGGLSLQSDPGLVAESVHAVGAEYLTVTLFPLPEGVQMRPQAGEDVEQMLARVAATMTADQWRRAADFLNAKGEQFRRQGVKFAYHNHNPELAPQGETNGLAILLEHTDPKAVSFEMDAGWVVAAGHDPVELLRAYPGRFRLMHVKDIAPTQARNTVFKALTPEVGSGIVNWARVIPAAITSGVRHFALEQEPPFVRPPLESAKIGFDFLSRLTG